MPEAERGIPPENDKARKNDAVPEAGAPISARKRLRDRRGLVVLWHTPCQRGVEHFRSFERAGVSI
jgi:hypothetical protein